MKLRRVFEFAGGLAIAWTIYAYITPYLADDGPIFEYYESPHVSDLDGNYAPIIAPGDVLRAHFRGRVRRECKSVVYLRWFVRVDGLVEETLKVPEQKATNSKPGDYDFSVTQKTPEHISPGQWVWRTTEIAECYPGVIWRHHEDMPFTVAD